MKHILYGTPICLFLAFILCQLQLSSVQAQGPLYSLLPFEEHGSLSSHVNQPEVGRQRAGHSALGKLLLRRATQTGQYRDSTRFQGVPCSDCWAILQDLSRQQKTLRPAGTYDFADITKKAMLNNGW